MKGLLYQFDLSAFRAIHVGLHEPWLDPIFHALTYTGLGAVCAVISLLFALSKSTRRLVIPLLLCLLVGGFFFADGVKALVVRERPSDLRFAHPLENIHNLTSFPSGHSADAFSLAFGLLFLTWGTPVTKWTWLALVWATLVGVSRVYMGVHWPTDVIGGMLCGLAAACVVSAGFTRVHVKNGGS